MKKVLLALGSNLGNRIQNINTSLKLLKSVGNVIDTGLLYETKPAYNENQGGFLNSAVMIETSLEPDSLLQKCKEIERTLGRTYNPNVPKGPRVIDIDILFYDNVNYQTENLTIPHPAVQERDFVLAPLRDFCPEWKHPILNKTIEQMYDSAITQSPIRSDPTPVLAFVKNGKEKIFPIGKKCYSMGIINCTPNSFFRSHLQKNKNEYSVDAAVQQAKEFLDKKVEFIDLGGESTAPNSQEVSVQEEIDRVLRVLEKLNKDPLFEQSIISIDTRKSQVAEAALKNGADLINDVSGGRFDERMFDIVAENMVPSVLMHSRGTPQNMQTLTEYSNLLEEICAELQVQIDLLLKRGYPRWGIIVDPGLGFAKTLNQNFEIIRNLDAIKKRFKMPLLAGYSHKSFLRNTIGKEYTSIGNHVLAGICVEKGADIIRYHDPDDERAIALANLIHRNRYP